MTNRRRFACLALASFILSCWIPASSHASRQSSGPLHRVRGLIADLGPRGALERLASDTSTFSSLLTGVTRANHDWLDLATQLIPVSQGHAEGMLVMAFSQALERDPIAVLQRGRAGIPLDVVCGYDPFTPVSSLRTRKQLIEALLTRERAVAMVHRADLAQEKQTCLRAVARLKAEPAGRYKQ